LEQVQNKIKIHLISNLPRTYILVYTHEMSTVPDVFPNCVYRYIQLLLYRKKENDS